MPEHSQDRIENVRVRRAPKISVFLVVGAVAGALVALILTFAFGGTAEPSPNTGVEYTSGQVFGFLVLICAPIGIVLAGLLALFLDRRSQRRAREVVVDHESVHVDPEPGTNGHGPGH